MQRYHYFSHQFARQAIPDGTVAKIKPITVPRLCAAFLWKKKRERQRSEASAFMSHAAIQTQARTHTHTQTTSWTQLQVSNGAGISFRLAAWINNGKRDLWDAHKNTLALPSSLLPPPLSLFPSSCLFPLFPLWAGTHSGLLFKA